MAVGVFGNKQDIALGTGVVTPNSLLGANTYEKIIVSVDQIGSNPGVVYVGKATAPNQVSATVYGDVIKTGETKEYYQCQVPNSLVVIGANMGFLNPSTNLVRIRMLGFATA